MSTLSSRAARAGRAVTWILLVGVALAGATAAALSPKGRDRLSRLVLGPSGDPVIMARSGIVTNIGGNSDTEQRLASIETALQRLQSKAIQTGDRINNLDVAVAGLKEQFGQVTGSVSADPATTILERTPPSAGGPSAGSVDVVSVPIGPEGVAAADRTNDVPEAPVLTPMINLAVQPARRPVVAALPSGAPAPIPVPTVSVTDFGIELSRAATIDELEREWKRLSRSQKRAMSRLEPRISLDFSSGDAAKLVLIAGPIRNAADAARLCAMLSSAGERCRTVPFGEDTVALNGQP